MPPIDRRMREIVDALASNVARVIIGKEEVVRLALVPLFSKGHLLIEDVPGVGKTMLARAIARSIDATFKRIQFTPDLLPLDVTGAPIYNQKSGEFIFREGPVFTHVLLADEINRATPRTQSALLECMEEFQVSIDGATHPMADLFLVIATQNPVEQHGTFPLPEAQLDRFMMQITVGYPTADETVRIMENQETRHPIDDLRAVASLADVREVREAVKRVHVDRDVKQYVISLVEATRAHPDALLGVSPRGALALFRAAQAWALFSGDDYVTPQHVKDMARSVLAHRLMIRPQARLNGVTPRVVVEQALSSRPVPIR